MEMPNFDGNALINALLLAKAKQKNDQKTVKLIETFEKRGLSLIDGMALVMEVVTIISASEGENDV